MRKFTILMLLAVAAMVSCEKSQFAENDLSNAQQCDVTVNLKTLETRGTNPDGLIYHLSSYFEGQLFKEYTPTTSGEFEVRLATGVEFTFVAWADYDMGYYNSDDLENITIDYSKWALNDVKRDAFFGTTEPVAFYESAEVVSMELGRPFAQINVYSTDMDEVKGTDLEIVNAKLSYSSELYTTLNCLTGEAGGLSKFDLTGEVALTEANYDEQTGTILISYDYLVAPLEGRAVANFTMEFDSKSGSIGVCDYTLPNIPYERNYQTNVYGNLFTKQGTIEIDVNELWDGDIDNPLDDNSDDKYANYVETSLSNIKDGIYPEGDFWIINDEVFPESTWYGMRNTITVANLGDRRISIYCPNYSGVLTEYAFLGCDALLAVDFPKVTSIEFSAFDGCTALETIYFPEVASIGTEAFRDCSALTSIDSSSMPKLESADSYAFSYCDGLLSVDLPLLSTVDTHLFYCCSLLESVNLPELESVGDFQFAYCEKLKSVNLPKVLSVAAHGFAGCKALETIELLSATYIGYVAFNGCDVLKSVNLPEVITIDSDIFNYCSELVTVKLPKVESIGTWQFSMCSSLTTLELATASIITSFGSSGFNNINTSNIHLTIGYSNSGIVTASNQWTPVGYSSPLTFASITTVGGPVYEETTLEDIQNGNFPTSDFWLITDDYGDAIQVITVSNLGDRRISIYCPNYSNNINSQAFLECDALLAVDFPKATAIDNSAFNGCTALESIYFPEVTSIKANAFSNCRALTSIDSSSMPKLESAGQQAFNECPLLKSVNLPELESVGNDVFEYCTLLESVNLPELKSVGTGAFYQCEKLKSVYLPKAETIGDEAFIACYALETIELLSATYIGELAFTGCAALKSVNFPEAQTIGTDLFANCTDLLSVKLPKVESIGTWQFNTCSSLTTLELATASTITSFGSSGFKNIDTSKINLTIGSSNSGIDTANNQWTPVGYSSPYTFASIITVQ